MNSKWLGIIIVVLISCSPTKQASEIKVAEKSNINYLNGNWQLQMLFASDNKWIKIPFISIDVSNKTFTGNSGCNAIRGKLIINNSYLAFDKNMISTKIACVDARGNNDENSFLSALLKINKFFINKDELELGQGEIVIMKFKRI